MRKKLFFLLCFLFFNFLVPNQIEASKEREKEVLIRQLLQKIEILKQEISLLQSLIKNSQSPKEITAQSYLALRLSDNSVLLEKNSAKIYPIASITKLMTAVIAFEKIDLNQKISLTKKMLEPFGYSPALYLGLEISAENLLKASLIQSSNDAAEALTYFLGKEKFLKLMNEKAKKLNLKKTIFYDAQGLNPKNLSTASDLAKLLVYIYKNQPEILEITRENNFWLPDKSGWLVKFQNLNNFYPLDNFLGGKAGYLPEAKQTLAGIFKVNGEAVAIVILSSKNRQADTFAILNRLKIKPQ